MKLYYVVALLAALYLTATTSYAVPPGPPSDGGDSVSESSSDSVAASSSDSVSSSGASAGSSAGASSGSSTGDSSAGVEVNSSESYDHDAWALDLPSATAAPAVALECLEHKRGWTLGPVFGMSGKTEYNDECVAFAQCLAVTTTYARLGEKEAALAVLDTCSTP